MWFELAIVSMLAYGLLDFLLKVAEQRNIDFSNLLLYYYWTAALAAFALFALFPSPIPDFPFLALFAVLQVSVYLISNVLKLESLRHIKSVLAYPIFALHGVAAAVLAFIFLGESLSFIQCMGILISIIAILLLVERKSSIGLNRGMLLALGAMLALAMSEVIVAAIIDHIVLLPFIALSYFFAIGPSFVIEKHMHKKGGEKKGAAALGAAMGITNMAGFYCMLIALGDGPASVIFPIIALALLVSILLSMLIYREKLSRLRIGAILLALLAILLLRVPI